MITNLLSNAFKYSYDGGNVELRLTCDEEHVYIAVADTGVGLDKDMVKHIFDRFYQGDNSRKMHINGTGIGLNLCKMIVDMHQGTIEAFNRTDVQHGKAGSGRDEAKNTSEPFSAAPAAAARARHCASFSPLWAITTFFATDAMHFPAKRASADVTPLPFSEHNPSSDR